MNLPLGNPTHKAVISVTATETTITITSGMQSIEFQNWSNNDVFFGATGVTSTTGGRIVSNGGSKTFEHIPSNWNITFICAVGKTASLNRIDYL